jgi:very-short-patch-repair endonuclease
MLDRARQLRRDMTLPEQLLWREVRGRGLGPRFRRQVPIGPYIVDFYCPQARLVVEVDGEFHGDRMIEDRDRAVWLDAQGYRVVRVQAVEVLTELEDVLERLSLLLTPLRSVAGPPPPPGGRSQWATGYELPERRDKPAWSKEWESTARRRPRSTVTLILALRPTVGLVMR